MTRRRLRILRPGRHDAHHSWSAITIDATALTEQLNLIFSGRGTSTLTLHGLPITIDATRRATQQLYLPGVNVFYSNTIQSYTLLADTYDLRRYDTNADIGSFIVKTDGTIDYASSLNTVFSGRGTSTLVYLGCSTGSDCAAGFACSANACVGTLGCADLLECVDACSTQACLSHCYDMATAHANQLYTALDTCIVAHCETVCSGAEQTTCSTCVANSQSGRSPTGQTNGVCTPTTDPACGVCVDQLLTCADDVP